MRKQTQKRKSNLIVLNKKTTLLSGFFMVYFLFHPFAARDHSCLLLPCGVVNTPPMVGLLQPVMDGVEKGCLVK